MKIPLLLPDLPHAEDLLPYLRRIDAARWYTNFGPLVQELETSMGEILSAGGQAQNVVTVSNATAGIELALQALQLRPGARVLVPALTFVATATAVLRAGAVPVFADVDAGAWLLTPGITRQAVVAGGIDAVIPVATYGCPCDATAWDAFSEQTGIPVVIDAAGAFGSQSCGQRIAVVFSMHATKALAAAEGGIVASTNAGYCDRVRSLSNFGIDPTAPSGADQGGSGRIAYPGTNAKLSEYHAALALASLAKWNTTKARRIALHSKYLAALGRLGNGLTLQGRPAAGVYSILPVLLPEGTSAAEAHVQMQAHGIQTRRWYCPILPDHPAFASMPSSGPLPVSNTLGRRLLGLPFHLFLSEADIAEVANRLADFLGGASQ